MPHTVHFPSGATDYHFHQRIKNLEEIIKGRKVVTITDKNLFGLYSSFFENYKTIIIPTGEKNKTWETAKHIAEELIRHEVDKTHLLIGVGGGVVTDIAGFVAANYMRGISTAFIPTSLLAMVDAAIGGKNGVNIGVYKNMMGTVRQPKFIFYDVDFLQTLPEEEWCNGFAEIIKYGCIFDRMILDELAKNDIDFYKTDKAFLQSLIEKCVSLKNKTVLEDEHEKNIRKLLNFGHTVGHAIENTYQLAHGKAIAIGMMVACKLSEKQSRLKTNETSFLKNILQRYHLPTSFQPDIQAVMHTLKMDKKRANHTIDFVVLEKLGKASVRKTTFTEIEEILVSFS